MAYSNKLREEMAKQFLGALTEGKLPWLPCWQHLRPKNAFTGKPYRGVNAAFLSYVADEKGFPDHRWCTFRQIQEKGWHLAKGSKGFPVEYWAYYDKAQKKLLDWKEARVLMLDPEYARDNLVLRTRVYTVFNGSCIEGIPPAARGLGTDIGSIRQQRDLLLQNMKLSYREGGSEAYYTPSLDQVTLPPEKTFLDTYSYMGTFLHECAHATGHPDRLNRELMTDYGSKAYAKEELRAEIASAFTAQGLGLQLTDAQLQWHMQRHKAYVQSWAEVLGSDPDELFRAMKDAERISDYLIEKGEFDRELEQKQPEPREQYREELVEITQVQQYTQEACWEMEM